MIELFVNKTCQQTEITKREIEQAMRELGIREPVTVRVIQTYGDARKSRIEGSPEVQIDGEDIDPQGHINFSHEACRTYFLGERFGPSLQKE